MTSGCRQGGHRRRVAHAGHVRYDGFMTTPTPEAAVAALRRRLARQDPSDAALAAALRACLPELVTLLVSRYGVRRVVLFGSLARGRADKNSDIDLAVEGLAPEDYFPALTEAYRLVKVDVDIVRLEEAHPDLLRVIAEHGEVLHEYR